MPRKITPEDLVLLIGTDRCPWIVDVRRASIFEAAPDRIAGALWRNHMDAQAWSRQLSPERPIVVYCVHGHNVSEVAAAGATAAGADVIILDGGIEAWRKVAGPLVANRVAGLEPGLPVPSVWVTRERPKVDRIACPWLIRRFVDPQAVIQYVAADWVRDVAQETGAIPFDVEGVHYSHRGEGCTFDTMLIEFGLADEALLHLAAIVRGADTARPELAPQAAGLLAVSLGLSAIEDDDHAQLEKGMIIYDALYGWCRHAMGETHNWPVKAQ